MEAPTQLWRLLEVYVGKLHLLGSIFSKAFQGQSTLHDVLEALQHALSLDYCRVLDWQDSSAAPFIPFYRCILRVIWRTPSSISLNPTLLLLCPLSDVIIAHFNDVEPPATAFPTSYVW